MTSARGPAIELSQRSPAAECAELRVLGDTSRQHGPQETARPVALTKSKHSYQQQTCEGNKGASLPVARDVLGGFTRRESKVNATIVKMVS